MSTVRCSKEASVNGSRSSRCGASNSSHCILQGHYVQQGCSHFCLDLRAGKAFIRTVDMLYSKYVAYTEMCAALNAAKTYTRILQDIKTVLAHPWALTELLTEHLPVLMATVALLDRSMEYKRKLGSHAEWPDDAWLNPVQLEVISSLYQITVRNAS